MEYYHTDMIGATRFTADSTGDDIDSAVYTAFGERVSGTQHRYGYAGAWGYQTDDDVPFLHVGYRYYDPVTGRFLQRDPIGIEGGPNVYVYVRSRPTRLVDPTGVVAEGLPRKGRAWWILAALCVQLIEREVVPRIDDWVEDNYDDEMDELDDPYDPDDPWDWTDDTDWEPPPTARPPPELPDVEVPPCFSKVL